jgi:hypothetical protein
MLNRWNDKLQIIVCENGSAGVNFEHSAVDGHSVLRFVSDVFTDTIIRFAQSIHGGVKAPLLASPSIATVDFSLLYSAILSRGFPCFVCPSPVYRGASTKKAQYETSAGFDVLYDSPQRRSAFQITSSKITPRESSIRPQSSWSGS